ncbi:Huntingtin [Aphelenchoides bicaudatus]|nr:Huntingtin [Aphelenchoides bicaudatus]
MSVQFEKKLKKAITILENDGASKTSSPKRNRDGFAEAVSSIKKVLADEQYWSKIYGNRAINCVFNVLGVDDGSLRLLADQCLNAIFRKFILKSQPSRALIALLNELSKNGGSARGFAAALSMLPIVLKHGREHRMQVYAMHFLHVLREAIKRPEQAVHSAIETFASDLIRFFRSDYVDAHEPYANRLMIQCLENLALSGMYSNRAAASVLASLSENIPGMMPLVCGRIIGLLAIVEEGKHKNETVGLLSTLKRMWPALVEDQPKMAIKQIVVKVLGCLNSTLSEIKSATLELLQLIVLKTPFIILDFQPHFFKAECNSDDERKSSSHLFEMDPLADLNESFISRSSSISSLVESEANTSRADSLVADENGSDTDEMSNRSGESTPKNRESYIEMDPLFQTQTDSPIADYLLDKQFENELVISGTPINEEVKGFLCARLPTCSCPPNADFYLYSATLIAEKFLLTGKLGEIRPDSEVRTSLKMLALKYLAAIGTVYENLTNVTVCVDGVYRQPLSDLHQLLSSSDEGISMAVFNLFASLENTYHKNGQRFPSTFYPTGRFLTLTATLLQNSNPRRLKEIFQILADNIDLVMGDEHLFMAIARAELFAKIRWNCLSPQMISAYQSLCLTHFCRQCFDSDFRVVSATMDNFKSLVENAEFGFISNVFNVYWNDNLFLPSFNAFSQVFALHPNYSFRGESPDLSLEENLSEILETLTAEYSKKPGERTAGYVNALLVLARSYPTCYIQWRLGLSERPKSITSFNWNANRNCRIVNNHVVTTCSHSKVDRIRVVENAFIKGANRAEFNKNIAYLEGQQTLDKIVILYLRLMNLYYTIIKESTTVASTTASLASPLFPKISWSSSSEQESSPVYNISNLNNAGIRPYKSKTSFLNSSSLCLLEPSSMKTDVEERIVAPLEAALDGFCCLIEVLPRELLISFIDELFLYVRTCTNLALRSITSTLTQMLKCIFGENALNINANLIVLLKSRHSISPTDQLEMLIGRSINNYSVHVAFLDRFEQMDLHRLKHFGCLSSKSSVNLAREHIKQPVEISTHLEQFEKSVTYLLHAYLNISDVEARCAVLKLICVLVLKDVRYDKLDPNNRVLNSVLATARHERFKNGESIGMLFMFLCVVSRSVDSLSFDEVVDLACKCVERVNYSNREDVDIVLNAVHVVLAEAISFYSTMPRKLIEALSKENLFEKSPAKVIELWTAVIHWSRSTDRLWQEMSTNFVDALFVFVAKTDIKFNNDNYKERLDLAHALSIALKTCNPIVFRPINQLFATFLDVSARDLFLCIPFTLALFCRLDQEDILMQLFEADSSSLKSAGRNLATLILRETTALIRNVNKSHINSLEDSISFFGIMLFHILRSETTRNANFSAMLVESFRSTIEESNEFDNLKASLASIAHLHPKIYAVWLLLLFQLELFDEPSKTLFSSNLPHHAKQLVALLFIQRLCDERLQINEAILKLLNSAPDEFLVRLLKLARPKQLASIKKRMPTETLKHLVEKTRTYLSAHPMTGVFDSIAELTDKAVLFQSDDLPHLYNNIQSWILSGKVQALDKKQSECAKNLFRTLPIFDEDNKWT